MVRVRVKIRTRARVRTRTRARTRTRTGTSRIIHVGTGIPELTIDQLTNQKILEYHRRATDMIHERKNDK